MGGQIVICIVIVAILLFWLSTRQENMSIPPWELETCKQRCFTKGQQIPWGAGDPRGPWSDPFNQPSATFDVAGCMAQCDRATWSS